MFVTCMYVHVNIFLLLLFFLFVSILLLRPVCSACEHSKHIFVGIYHTITSRSPTTAITTIIVFTGEKGLQLFKH